MIPYLLSIPYYVWLGVHPTRDVSRAVQAFEVESGNTLSALSSPVIPSNRSEEAIPPYSLDGALPIYETPQALSFSFEKLQSPLTAFHYNTGALRLPYVPQDIHEEFR